MSDNSRLVYSTERVIARKEKKQADTGAVDPSSRRRTIVRLDRKGRGGKTVTVVEGLHLSEPDSEKLLKQLKAKLGTGGAVKNGALRKSRETIATLSWCSCQAWVTTQNAWADKTERHE